MKMRGWIAAAALLGGCPGSGIEPVFPADYAVRYREVRDCRRSPDHDLAFIRVLASPEAAPVYASRAGAFPEGAVLVKEEYADAACTDLLGWTAMQRQAGAWRWQEVGPDRQVVEDGAIERCASCHAVCGVPEQGGYEGTCAMP